MLVSHEQFVKKWSEAHKKGESQSWIARELGVSRQLVSNRAVYLRRRGVRLPKLVYATMQLDADELNALLENEEQKTV